MQAGGGGGGAGGGGACDGSYSLEARVAEDKDFAALKALLATEAGWVLEYERAGVRVWAEGAAAQGALRTVKVVAEFPDVSPDALYDVLHDPEYRAVWDSHMIAAEDAGHINVNNDVGYYAMSCPAPLKNRDFVLQRSWLDTGHEKMILNHSVYHKNFPPRKGFVRAMSMMTGFVVRPLQDIDRAGGSWLGYVSRSDPRGALPAWLVNRVTAQLAPRLVKQLHAAAREYPIWKRGSPAPHHKPWLNPDQVPEYRISILDCEDPEAVKTRIDPSVEVSTSKITQSKPYEVEAQSVEDLADFSSEASLVLDIEHIEVTDGNPSKRKGKFYKIVKGMRIRRKSFQIDKNGSNYETDGLGNDGKKSEKHHFKFARRLSRSAHGYVEKCGSTVDIDRGDEETGGKKCEKHGFSKFTRRFSRSSVHMDENGSRLDLENLTMDEKGYKKDEKHRFSKLTRRFSRSSIQTDEERGNLDLENLGTCETEVKKDEKHGLKFTRRFSRSRRGDD